MFCVLRSVYVLCFAFCFVFCVAFIFCDLRLIFVLCLFYVHLHHLFAVILYNATNSSDTDTAGKHKICKTRFVRTHKLPIAPCSMPFNVCFDEIILNFAPPFFFNTLRQSKSPPVVSPSGRSAEAWGSRTNAASTANASG